MSKELPWEHIGGHVIWSAKVDGFYFCIYFDTSQFFYLKCNNKRIANHIMRGDDAKKKAQEHYNKELNK